MLKYEIASKTDFKKRFKQEAVTIAKLTHPNILHVIETIDDYSTSFIIMEKLDGYDLKYYLQEQGVFNGKQTCDIISQLALALEYAERGITVNNVPPNFIDTEGLRAAPVDVAAFAQTTPMKRTGKPRNIAAAVAFLASEDADYITGLTLGVNGGRYCN